MYEHTNGSAGPVAELWALLQLRLLKLLQQLSLPKLNRHKLSVIKKTTVKWLNTLMFAKHFAYGDW